MTRAVAVGTRFMQEVNSSAILGLLRQEELLSVSELAARTGLSRQAVSRSLAILDDKGLIELTEPERQSDKAGRPPQLVRFKEAAGAIAGLNVQPRYITAEIANLRGVVIGSATVAVSPHELKEALGTAIDLALVDSGIAAGDVWHAAVGVPGIVERDTGRVVLSPSMPEAEGALIWDTVGEKFDCTVSIDNDINFACQGEAWREGPHTESSLVYVAWSDRIGAAIVLDGEIYRGASNDAGDIGYLELGAVPERAESELGPFEHWVGIEALLSLVAGDARRKPTWEEFQVGIADRDPDCIRALDEICIRFARGIAVIRSLLDPDAIVIGGDMALLGKAILDRLENALRDERLNQPRLAVSKLGTSAIVLGALRTALSAAERDHLEMPMNS